MCTLLRNIVCTHVRSEHTGAPTVVWSTTHEPHRSAHYEIIFAHVGSSFINWINFKSREKRQEGETSIIIHRVKKWSLKIATKFCCCAWNWHSSQNQPTVCAHARFVTHWLVPRLTNNDASAKVSHARAACLAADSIKLLCIGWVLYTHLQTQDWRVRSRAPVI